MSEQPPHVGFVLELSLGHVTHAHTLGRLLPQETAIRADIAEIDFAVDGIPARVPMFNSNWTVRSGLRARRAIRRMHRRAALDALFVHTQVSSVLVPDWIGKIPSVVSLDATPLQYDELGSHYQHTPGNARVERLKWKMNRTSLRRARHIVTWSAWAKAGVVDGYGIEADKITVLPPGVDPQLWAPPPDRARADDVVRILFVGGDLARKGGDVLLEAFGVLHREQEATGDGPRLQLDLVTKADVADSPGVVVHRSLTSNAPELIALYHAADVFVLPTRADCLPIALMEAGAAGLALVATSIAGVPEIVREGETGLLVPPDDRDALVAVLRELIADPDRRRRLGDGAGELVAQRFDAVANTHQLAELLADVASGPRAPVG